MVRCLMSFKCLYLLAFVTFGAFPLSKDLKVETTINLKELYGGSITKVGFSPDKLDLEIKADKSGFESASSQLNIETSIPKDVAAIGYTVQLEKNEAYCFAYDDTKTVISSSSTPVSSHFVAVEISELPSSGCTSAGNVDIAADGTKKSYADFCGNDNTYKTSEHKVTLSFKPFSYLLNINPILPRKCGGDLLFKIEVAL